jgi:hypothetical protein
MGLATCPKGLVVLYHAIEFQPRLDRNSAKSSSLLSGLGLLRALFLALAIPPRECVFPLRICNAWPGLAELLSRAFLDEVRGRALRIGAY